MNIRGVVFLLIAQFCAADVAAARTVNCERGLGAESDAWDADLYQSTYNFRSPPFKYLMSMVKKKPDMRVLDLGCGTGNWTCAMHEQLGAETTLGVDLSKKMLVLAKQCQTPGLTFQCKDLETFNPTRKYDLIVSMAAIMWVQDQDGLLSRLHDGLKPGGQLAIDMAMNEKSPFWKLLHKVADDLIAASPFCQKYNDKCGDITGAGVWPARDYSDMLDTAGFIRKSVQVKTHIVHPRSWQDVLNYVHSTAFVFYKMILPRALMEQLQIEYDKRFWTYVEKLKKTSPQPVFELHRMYIWAQRSE